MRIAVSGVPGTGKTTLCKTISKNTVLEIIPEIENGVLREEGYSSWRELFEKRGSEGMIDIFFLSLKRKISIEKEKSNFVSDKSGFDCGARWFSRMWAGATSEQHGLVRSAMESFSEVYDKVVYLPLKPDREVFRDSERTADFNLRYQRNLILSGLFYQYNVKPIEYDFNFSDSSDKVLKDLGLEEFKRNK